MTQDRLIGLTILSIEKNILKNIDVEHIIDDFASKNARRGHLRLRLMCCMFPIQDFIRMKKHDLNLCNFCYL